jgi:hypothetical protein
MIVSWCHVHNFLLLNFAYQGIFCCVKTCANYQQLRLIGIYSLIAILDL